MKKLELEVLAVMGLEELKGLKLEELTKNDQKKVTKRITKLEAELNGTKEEAPEKAPEAPKKATKKNKQPKATIITKEEETVLEEKKEVLRKYKYGTAGTQWELLPNLLDTKMNTHNKEMIDILNTTNQIQPNGTR
jgi:vacuolar-type H+-ATPase subunit H